MQQKTIRNHNGQTYTIQEASDIFKELSDRTQSNEQGYNSINELGGKVKNLENNQITGVKTFEDLDDNSNGKTFLPITGDVEVSYKVTNVTNPSSTRKNGYYSWSGSVYTFEDSLVVGNIEKDNIDAVSGGKVYDTIIKKANLLNNKNIYVSDELITGAYIKYTNGVITSNAGYSYIKIEVKPNTTYTWSNDVGSNNLEQFSWTESDGTFVDGNIGGSESITFTTSSTTKYVLLSINNSYLNSEYQLEEGAERSEYIEGRLEIKASDLEKKSISPEHIKNESISDELINPSSNIVLKRVGVNVFDINSIISGAYIKYTNGVVTSNAGYSYSDFIELKPNTDYNWSNGSLVTNLEQFASYDNDKNYLSGHIGAEKSITFNTGNDIKYVRFSINNNYLNLEYQLEEGTERSLFKEYSISLKVSDLEKKSITSEYLNQDLLNSLSNVLKTIVTVDINGSKQFTSLRDAINSCTNLSTKYEIQIKEGEYDIMSYFTQAEIETSGFKGLDIPNNVSLVGIGRKEFVHLKGELDTNIYPPAITSIVSTLNTKGSGDFINLKVTALNLRYAVHDDVNFIDLVRYVKDCIFYHYQGAGFGQAYGEGCRSGGNFTFENCYFYTEQNGSSYSTHNNVNFDKPSKHKYINCVFDNKEGDLAIRFGSMGSGQKDIIELVGCKFNGRIYIMEEQSNGVGIDFEITGYGNDIVPIEIEHTTNNQYTYNLTGQTISRKNEGNSNILKGDALKLSINGKGVEKMQTSDDASLFYGIAFNDFTQDNTGIVKIGGFHQLSDTNLTGLNIGDKIGVVNGELSVVSVAEYISVVLLTGFIRIK